MSLNGTSPISAFAVYKKKMINKHKFKKPIVPPAKKIKVDPEQSTSKLKIKIKPPDSKSNKVKSVTNNVLPSKKDKKIATKTDKAKLKKKKLKLKKKHNIKDDEEPPLLVPISSKNSISQNGPLNVENKLNEINKTKNTIESDGAALSQIISELNKTDPSPEVLKLFKWFIAPLSPKIFFSKYWENQVLHIERNVCDYYSQILTTQRLDDIFREFPLYYNRNVDVVSYENGVKELHNEEGRVVASALYDYYSNGCSIRILNPQTYDQKVHLLIATLQEYFGTMVGTNVYLTPPGSQGFAPHYDDIEAFVVQLEGRKHWKLYKPTGSDVLARDSSPNLKYENIGKPFMEVTLNAGDLLYFPRGTIHEGRTDEALHSLHITVSVYQHTAYVDLLEHILPQALKKAATDDIEFRKGLPINYLKDLGHVNKDSTSEERNAIIEKVQSLVHNLVNYVDVDQAADKLGRKFMYDSMPPVLSKMEVKYTSKLDGDYMKDGKVFNRVEIGMDTEVRLVRYHCLRLAVEDDTPKIYYNTDNAKVYHGEEEQFLTVDHNLIPCIKILQNNYPEFIQVENLPIKDEIAKAQLVSDLWERGLLVTNGPLPAFDEDNLPEDSDGMSESSLSQ